jgi:3-isopropylmalate/(R)-2-methylmalate dehydratase small subunit
MEPLVHLASAVVPLLRDNVDTDAIIPAAYMRSLATDPGTGLFGRWRYRADGSADPGFVLNDPRYAGARILLAGANFGCGSSRENAVWALARHGILAVLAPSFGDIFHENCFKNGVLPITLDPRDHERLVALCTRDAPCALAIDVARGEIRTAAGSDAFHFELEPRKRTMLMNGTDEIAATLAAMPRIDAFRALHRRDKPWLYAPGGGAAGGGA